MDHNKIREFWENQANKEALNIRCQTNFIKDEYLQRMTIEKETEYIKKHLPLKDSDVLFDIGAGTGFWSEYFSKKVRNVYSVEYVKKFCDVIRNKNISNIEVINSNCENFTPYVKADIVFLSGIVMYLTNEIAKEFVRKIPSYVKCGGYIFLREPVSLLKDDYIVNKFSEELGTVYQAYYRSIENMIKLFNHSSFKLIEYSQFFEEDSPLNKWKETRRFGFLFQKTD